MNITFKSRKLEKTFNEGKQLESTHGSLRAKRIRARMKEFRGAECLKDFWPPKSPPSRCHELTEGQRKGQFSADLDHPYRLIFIPNHDPVPRLADGSVDWLLITSIMIIGIEDTHG